MTRRLLSGLTSALLTVGVMATTAIGAHNGNNRAVLTGTGDPDASGVAIVNYGEGRGTFNGTIHVSDLSPGETYTFFVRGAGGEQPICSDSSDTAGTFTCAEQKLSLAGFGTAVVRDAQPTIDTTRHHEPPVGPAGRRLRMGGAV